MIQLELDFFAVPQVAKPVKPAPICSAAELKEWQEIEWSYMFGRAAYLYKDLERWLIAEAKRKAEINKVFNK